PVTSPWRASACKMSADTDLTYLNGSGNAWRRPGPLPFRVSANATSLVGSGLAGFPRFAIGRAGVEPGTDLAHPPDDAASDPDRRGQLAGGVPGPHGAESAAQEPRQPAGIDHQGRQLPLAFDGGLVWGAKTKGGRVSHGRPPSARSRQVCGFRRRN